MVITSERLDKAARREQILDAASEVFAEHFWVCMVADRYAVMNRHLIGLDKLMWECDFPHNDSNWPDSRKVLADAVHDIPDDEARQIGELNARRLYNFF